MPDQEVTPEATPAVEEVAQEPLPEATPEATAPAPEEAPVAKKGKGKTVATEKKKGVLYYISAEKETHSYSILIRGNLINPYWDNGRNKLIWECPEEHKEAFEIHHHFLTGRVVVKDNE